MDRYTSRNLSFVRFDIRNNRYIVALATPRNERKPRGRMTRTRARDVGEKGNLLWERGLRREIRRSENRLRLCVLISEIKKRNHARFASLTWNSPVKEQFY